MGRIRIRRLAGSDREPGEQSLEELSEALYRALRRILFLAAALFIIFQLAGPITNVLLLFLLVFIISAILIPVASWLEERGIPRGLSAVVLVLLLVAVAGLVLWLAVPPLLAEVGQLSGQIQALAGRLESWYRQLIAQYPQLAGNLPPPEELIRRVGPGADAVFGRLQSYLFDLVTMIFGILLLIVLVIYTVAQPEPLIAGLLGFFPRRYRDNTERVLRRSMDEIKNWAWAAVLEGLIVAAITWAGLHFLFDLPHALLFGVLAGFGELIPTFGPILAAVPAVIFALVQDPTLALWVALFYVVLQQIEGNILVPLLMGRMMQLHPVSILFMLLVLHSVFGVLGAILAVPVAAILKICWDEYYLKPRAVDKAELGEDASEIVAGEGHRGSGDTPGRGEEPAGEEERRREAA